MRKTLLWLSLTIGFLSAIFIGLMWLREQPFFYTFVPWFQTAYTTYFDATIPFFVVANLFYAVILVFGYINARSQYIEKLTNIGERLTPLRSLKPISILVPSYNEEMTVKDSVSSMLRLDYPEYEVIVCNDGSKDDTLSVIIEAFALVKAPVFPPKVLPSQKIRAVYRSPNYPNLIVIDKDNGGKADALNACINFSQYPLICCVDSDSIIDRDGLINVSMPFLEDSDTIATGGTILTVNVAGGKTNDKFNMLNTSVTPTWMGMIQSVEYLRAFLVGRLGWDYLGCDSIISGAFGLFKKSLVIRVGGYAVKTIGEDMELLLRMQSYAKRENEPYKVRLLPTPVCWTEPPSDLKTLGNQRTRWAQGLAESLWLHRNMLFRPWAGALGTVGLPYYLFFELLSAPIEIIGYAIAFIGLGLGIFDPWVVGAFMAATIMFGCVLNLGAIVIDQVTFEKYNQPSDLIKLIAGAVLEHFGFRQIHLYWRLRGLYRWLRGKQTWGEMKRVGLKGKPENTIQAAS